jgi:hypothetical protein
MKTSASFALIAAAGLALGGGCAEATKEKPAGGQTAAAGHDEKGHDHAEHEHSSTGPHGGHVIELGKEDYHAELIHDDDAGTVTIYVLDHEAKSPVAIEAKEVTINIKHEGKGEQFKLAAAPQDGEKDDRSSRFVSKDKELGEDLDHAGAEARLVLEINGKSYTGAIEHDHDH